MPTKLKKKGNFRISKVVIRVICVIYYYSAQCRNCILENLRLEENIDSLQLVNAVCLGNDKIKKTNASTFARGAKINKSDEKAQMRTFENISST